ncbi:MAG TPA: hypothetical protein VGH33_15130 [Isosphaeraceae bacterium]
MKDRLVWLTLGVMTAGLALEATRAEACHGRRRGGCGSGGAAYSSCVGAGYSGGMGYAAPQGGYYAASQMGAYPTGPDNMTGAPAGYQTAGYPAAGSYTPAGSYAPAGTYAPTAPYSYSAGATGVAPGSVPPAPTVNTPAVRIAPNGAAPPPPAPR